MANDVNPHAKIVLAALPTLGVPTTAVQLPTGTTVASLAAKLGMSQDLVQGALRDAAIRF